MAPVRHYALKGTSGPLGALSDGEHLLRMSLFLALIGNAVTIAYFVQVKDKFTEDYLLAIPFPFIALIPTAFVFTCVSKTFSTRSEVEERWNALREAKPEIMITVESYHRERFTKASAEDNYITVVSKINKHLAEFEAIEDESDDVPVPDGDFVAIRIRLEFVGDAKNAVKTQERELRAQYAPLDKYVRSYHEMKLGDEHITTELVKAY